VGHRSPDSLLGQSTDSLYRSVLKAAICSTLVGAAKNRQNTLNIGLNSQLSKSDFEAKKMNPIQFLRCGNSLKKRCRKYRAKLAILKSIQADFASDFFFEKIADVAIAVAKRSRDLPKGD